MKRIIWHWTGGGYKANPVDKRSYHRITEGNGKIVLGNFPISANKRIVPGKYAPHTYRLNTDSIGQAMACMRNAKQHPLSYGNAPMTEVQFEACMKDSAELCVEYDIPVSDKTTLSHAEVEENLGVKQKNKWDFVVLPFKPELKGAKACGDYARSRVQYYLDQMGQEEPIVAPVPQPASTPKKLPWLCELLKRRAQTPPRENSQR